MRKDRGKDQDKVLTLRRSGSVVVGARLIRAQCGYHGERLLTYDVTVSGREIDCPRGWLLDNNDIPRYFEETYGDVREFKSCEAVASRAVDDFITIMTESYKARPVYVRVAVSGIKDSEISCEWHSRRHGV